MPGLAARGARPCAPALRTTEVFPLTLFAVGGMMLFPAAGDLLTMFVALEVLSLPLYILSGLARRRRLLSQEASLKYFLLGAFSSAFFLFGAALLYGYAGSLNFADIATAITAGSRHGRPAAAGRRCWSSVGLLFKVGAVPFHSWTPDVYQGAPTPVTGFMAACTKVAAFGAILRLVYVGVAGRRWDWQPVLVGRRDPDHGRRLGAVGHPDRRQAPAGLLLDRARRASSSSACWPSTRPASRACCSTSSAYGFTTIARVRRGRRWCATAASEATHLSQWAGLGKRHPVVAGVFAFLLLAFAGIPLTSGFTAKYAVFAPAVAHGGAGGLVVIGVLAARSRRSSTSG